VKERMRTMTERDVEKLSGAAEDPARSDAPPSGLRRAAVAVVALTVFTAVGGLFLWEFLQGGPPVPPSSDRPLPSSLTIRCAGETSITPSRVGLGPSGLQVRVENDARHELVYMRDREHIERSSALDIAGVEHGQHILVVIPPGEWIVGCFSGAFSTSDHPVSDYTGSLTVEDPDGNWPLIQEARTCGASLPTPVSTAGQDTCP
jgi:hypothetical protein